MDNSHPSRTRRYRHLLFLVALIISLSGVWTPASARQSIDTYAILTHHASRITQPTLTDLSLATPNTQPAIRHPQSELPVPAPPEVSTGRFRYFSETAHFVRGIFLTYWETHGATAILGLPLTEVFVEDGLAVQYLERARLEWHPDISTDPRQQVLLTRLGAITTEARGVTFPPQPDGANTDNSHFFTETGHNLANAFLTYWLRNGGLAVFGYPLSEEVVETNEADGKAYAVQYFERNRFEWHPERSASNNVQLGLLGTEYARMEGLNPLARILLPGEFAGSDVDQSHSPQLADLVDGDLLSAVQLLGRTPQFRWVPALIVKYKIAVRFEAFDDKDVAGAFIVTRSKTRPYSILVPEAERGEPDEALASVLAHEATHGADVVTGVLTAQSNCSIEAEMRSFMNGLAAWVLLQGEDALSQTYERGSFSASVNASLRRFNGNNTRVEFSFSPQTGRDVLRNVYGADCGR